MGTEEKPKEPAVETPPTEAMVVKPKAGELINVFELADSFDDEEIVKDLTMAGTDSMERFIYKFEDRDGKVVIGLSKNGVDEICQQMERQGIVIRDIGTPQVVEIGEYIHVLCQAGRYYIDGHGHEQLGTTATGSKRQWKKIKKRDNKIIDNPFFFEQGVMKASRNAKRRLMPEMLIKKLIAERIGSNKIRTIKVEGKIDNDGNVIAEGVDAPPEAAEKSKLFKKIVDSGKIGELNAVLKGRKREELSIAALEAVLGKKPETKVAMPKEHPLEAWYKEYRAMKKLTIDFAAFYNFLKVLFKEVNLEEPTFEQLAQMRKVIEPMTKEQIEGGN